MLWNKFSDPPGSVTITPGNNTFYTKRNGKPVQNITCKADCLPECTYEWYREGHRSVYMYTTGSSLFARQTYFYKGSYRFRCLASNNIRSNYSRWITVEEKGRIVYVYRFVQCYKIIHLHMQYILWFYSEAFFLLICIDEKLFLWNSSCCCSL